MKRILINLFPLFLFIALIGAYFYVMYKEELLTGQYNLAIYYKSMGDFKNYHGYSLMFNLIIYLLLPIHGIAFFFYPKFKLNKKDIQNNETLRREYHSYYQYRLSFGLIFIFDVYFLSLYIPPLERFAYYFLILYLNTFQLIINPIVKHKYKNLMLILDKKIDFSDMDLQETTPQPKFFFRLSFMVTILLFLFTSFQLFKFSHYFNYPQELVVTEQSAFHQFRSNYWEACDYYDDKIACHEGKELIKDYRLDKVELEFSITDFEKYLKDSDFLLYVYFNGYKYYIDQSQYTINQDQTVHLNSNFNTQLQGTKMNSKEYRYLIIQFVNKDKQTIEGFNYLNYQITFHLKDEKRPIINFKEIINND